MMKRMSRLPEKRRCTALIGMMTTSSWSWKPPWPREARVPITSQLMSRMRKRSPTGCSRAEQVLLDGDADDADRLAGLLLGVGPDAAVGQRPLLGGEELRGGAVDRGLPVGGVADGEARRLRLRRDRADAGDLLLDRLDVGHVEIGRLRPAAAAAEALAGADLQDVGAEARNLLGDRRGRALAERHHRHHRGDADDDAERGQEGAQQVPADLAEGEDDGGEEHHGFTRHPGEGRGLDEKDRDLPA